ncbi:MAG: hypothetical protein ACTSRZ_03250 [Promethearchaeota archaeon]
MIDEILEGVKEVFSYKELFKDIVFAAMNPPEYTLDQIFPIYEQFYDLVLAFNPISIEEFQKFLDFNLIEYSKQPFFPIIAGLYVSAIINRIFIDGANELTVDLSLLASKILLQAQEEAKGTPIEELQGTVNFSLDFIGYLLPKDKTLTIKGPVGDYCGALMEENSKIILNGVHGKYLGYGKHESAEIIKNKIK